ncbi:hypothetical protein DFH08DRAFT_825457 [Mycena albidolilacea]|uniref:Uncharacterized protein n=1 Tax=Mycena albidolilacea TaxID=1033008 RepID=A0AAD7E9V7_9AGAR|nr:hypothetical protein DFH08DRAFT_825457 [Mycena albidolilacea]
MLDLLSVTLILCLLATRASLRGRFTCCRRSPGLDAMLSAPPDALSAHEIMCSDPEANRKIWGPGSVLLQLLAVQDSIGEPWDLNGDTFLRIQWGELLSSPPQAVKGLDVMWRSFDPIGRAGESRMTTSKFVDWEEHFKTTHTVYEPSSALFFYRRAADWTSVSFVPRPAINIQHAGKPILSARDLPFVGEGSVKRTRDTDIKPPAKRMKEFSLGPRHNPSRSKKAGPDKKSVQVTQHKKRSRFPGWCDESAASGGGTGAALCFCGGGSQTLEGGTWERQRGGAGGTAAVLAALSPCPPPASTVHTPGTNRQVGRAVSARRPPAGTVNTPGTNRQVGRAVSASTFGIMSLPLRPKMQCCGRVVVLELVPMLFTTC